MVDRCDRVLKIISNFINVNLNITHKFCIIKLNHNVIYNKREHKNVFNHKLFNSLMPYIQTINPLTTISFLQSVSLTHLFKKTKLFCLHNKIFVLYRNVILTPTFSFFTLYKILYAQQ